MWKPGDRVQLADRIDLVEGLVFLPAGTKGILVGRTGSSFRAPEMSQWLVNFMGFYVLVDASGIESDEGGEPVR